MQAYKQFLPIVTLVASLSPAVLLAVTTRLLEATLNREQESKVVLQSCCLGVTLLSYTVYVVANTDVFHATVAEVLFPLYTTSVGGQGAATRQRSS